MQDQTLPSGAELSSLSYVCVHDSVCMCAHTTSGISLLTTYYNGHIHPTEMKKWIPWSS